LEIIRFRILIYPRQSAVYWEHTGIFFIGKEKISWQRPSLRPCCWN
jgi:hypothetical protein